MTTLGRNLYSLAYHIFFFLAYHIDERELITNIVINYLLSSSILRLLLFHKVKSQLNYSVVVMHIDTC